MTIQLKQAPETRPDTRLATPIALDRMGPPKAPLAMPKQVLTPQPGQMRRALRLMQSWLTLGRQGLRRAG